MSFKQYWVWAVHGMDRKESRNMKIQFLNGGLANQAFQYIFAKYYELSHPGDAMYMDDTYFALNTVHNGYELRKVFGITPHMLSECFDQDVWDFILQERRAGKSVPQIFNANGIEMFMVSEVGDGYKNFNPYEGRVVNVPCNEYSPEILDMGEDVYYHGYWINKKWFAAYQDTFLKIFRFPEITDDTNRRYLDEILNTNSVSIHIRRGDYVNLGAAMDSRTCRILCEKFASTVPGIWNLFVFSDDIPWCREHQQEMGFGRFDKVTYVEGNVRGKNYRDMQLMSHCKGMILSNSAFCYLAALLNTRKIYHVNPTMREI